MVKYVSSRSILDMEPIKTDSASSVTVCVLTSKSDWKACLWSLASLYILAGIQNALLIYDDGTLTRYARNCILQVFPAARIIDRRSVDNVMSRVLSAYPNCLSFREAQPCARRIMDYPIVCGSPHVLMLDSDIFFFSPPKELARHIQNPQAGRFIFEQDCQDAYFAPRDHIRNDFGVDVAPHVNCGIMLADVANFDYGKVEGWLGKPGVMKHPWAEQTLWAMYAGYDRTDLLGTEYDVTMSPHIGTDTGMKHYIKPIREFMYTEGIPHLRSMFQARGMLKG